MPRICTVCQHPKRGEIDSALVRGVSPYELESIYSDLKRAAIQRHKEGVHIPRKLLKAQEAQEISDAERIAGELEAVKADVRRLAQKAEEEGDIRTALIGCDRALKALELQAKLAQIISDAPQVNVITSPEWVEIRTLVVNALGPHPDAKRAVVEALEGAGNG